MKLVDDAGRAWRWHSMQILAALAVLPMVWAELPDDVKAWVPDEWRLPLLSLLAVAGIVGRIRAQK